VSLTRYTSTGGREELHKLAEHVAHSMGKALKPERVLFARDLPKTRSAKIMRRVIRATYLGKNPFFVDAGGTIRDVVLGPITPERARAAMQKTGVNR